MTCETKPAWVPCDCCGEPFCLLHDQRAFECDCPPVDEWPLDQDPYSAWPREEP